MKAASKPRWRGLLSIGLVSVPVHLYATADKKSQTPVGHGVHRTCQTQSATRKWCEHCNKEIPEQELMKGYDVPADLLAQPAMTGKSKFVELSDTELENVKVESTKTIRVTVVAAASKLEPLMVNETCYLVSDGTAAAAEAEATLVEALKGRVAIGSLVMNNRERQVAIVVHGAGMILHVLRPGSAMKALPDRVPLPTPNPQMVALAKQLFDAMAGDIDLADTTDRYAAAMQALVIEKAQLAAGETLAPLAATPAPKKVASLLDALAASLKTAKVLTMPSGKKRKSA